MNIRLRMTMAKIKNYSINGRSKLEHECTNNKKKKKRIIRGNNRIGSLYIEKKKKYILSMLIEMRVTYLCKSNNSLSFTTVVNGIREKCLIEKNRQMFWAQLVMKEN